MSNYYKIFFDIVKDFGLKKFYFIIILFTILPFVELVIEGASLTLLIVNSTALEPERVPIPLSVAIILKL